MDHHTPQPKERRESGAIHFFRENGALMFSISLFGAIFYLLTGTLFDHTLNKGYPFPYFASDQFSYLAKAEIVLEQGHYRYIPGYMTEGMLEKSLVHYGPGVIHLAAISAKLLGTEPFNANPLIFGLLLLFMPFMFLGALHLRREIKLITLSFLPLMLTFNFVIGYLWGQYNSFVGTFFLFLLFFALNNEKYRRPAYIGIILAALAISHFPELLFAMIYLAAITIVDMLGSRGNFTPAGMSAFIRKRAFLLHGFAIFLLLSAFFLVIFYYGNFKGMGSAASDYAFKSVKPSEFGGLRVVTFTDFPSFLEVLIAAGVLITIFSSRGIDKASKTVLILVLLFSNFNYIGLFPQAAYRAFQQRYLWPFTLTIFAGIAISFLVSAAGRAISATAKYKNHIFAALFLMLFWLSVSGYRPISGPGVISKEQFEAFRFLENNASGGDVLFLYGGGYDQSTVMLRRLHYRVDQQQMVKSLQEGGFDNGTIVLYRPAFPILAGFNGTSIIFANPQKPNKTICDFRYYIFDRYSQYNSQLLMFNQLFWDRIDKSKFSVAYSNNQVVILENKGGKPCML